jgi:integrase
MATIRERSKGTFTIQIFLGRDPKTWKENNYIETVKGTKTDAKRRVSELEHQFNTGAVINPSKYTIRHALEDWLKNHGEVNIRATTLAGYKIIVNKHLIPSLGSIPLHKFQATHLEAYYADKRESGNRTNGKGLSNTTIKHHHRVLSEAIRYAVRMDRVARNVCEAVRPPKTDTKEMNYLTEGQIKQVLEASKGSRYYELYYLAIWTGMRRSELLGLRWSDVENLTISVNQVAHHIEGGHMVYTEPKTNSSKRTLDIHPRTALVLQVYRQSKEQMGIVCKDNDIVFSDPDGSLLLPDTVSHCFGKLMRQLGIEDVRFHDLRHTHATMMLKLNINAKIIQARLGHSSYQVTMDIYAHLMSDSQIGAIEAFEDHLNSFEDIA